MKRPDNILKTGEYNEPHSFENDSEATLFYAYLELIDYLDKLEQNDTITHLSITDEEIESCGYADCGDKSNHRFTSADEIEPWIEGAKWMYAKLTKSNGRETI